MLTVRSTRKLATALGVQLVEPDLANAPKLGHWYANLLALGRTKLVVFMNAPSRIVIICRKQRADDLFAEFKERLAALLARLGVPQELATGEVAQLTQVRFAKTDDRRLLGSLTDICKIVAFVHDKHQALDVAGEEDTLARMPHVKAEETFPDRALFALLGLNLINVAP